MLAILMGTFGVLLYRHVVVCEVKFDLESHALHKLLELVRTCCINAYIPKFSSLGTLGKI